MSYWSTTSTSSTATNYHYYGQRYDPTEKVVTKKIVRKAKKELVVKSMPKKLILFDPKDLRL